MANSDFFFCSFLIIQSTSGSFDLSTYELKHLGYCHRNAILDSVLDVLHNKFEEANQPKGRSRWDRY